MTAKEAHTVQLKPAQVEFLEQMTRAHDLDDMSKAIRCLVDFAIQESEHQDDIFQTIRCLHC